jgi:hypothetical protein
MSYFHIPFLAASYLAGKVQAHRLNIFFYDKISILDNMLSHWHYVLIHMVGRQIFRISMEKKHILDESICILIPKLLNESILEKR